VSKSGSYREIRFFLTNWHYPDGCDIHPAYRVRDERAIKFDRDMVEFWGEPKGHGRKWFEDYVNNIEQNEMQQMTEKQVLSLSKMYSTQYFITRKTASPLSWPIIFSSNYFNVYKVPNHITHN
jgi:hypothetical protein